MSAACYRDRLADEVAKSRAVLLETIDDATQIIISEHSLPYDWDPPRKDGVVEYMRQTLSSDQRAELRRIVKDSGDSSKGPGVNLGLIEPHHAIIFRNKDKELTLQVSFGAQVLDGGENSEIFNRPYSPDLVPALEAFFIKLGFKPRADWEKLASEIRNLEP